MTEPTPINITLHSTNLATIDEICQVANLSQRQDALNLIIEMYGQAVLAQLHRRLPRPTPPPKSSRVFGFTTAPVEPAVPIPPVIISQTAATKPLQPLN